MTLRCVIVDDNPDVLQAASEVLEGEGIAIVGMATSGDEAISLMRAHQPDLTLVDIDLGSESGFDLARRLAHDADRPTSQIILITASTRRWSSPVSDSGSLARMLRTCFSTVPSVTHS